jgi:adenylate cyclase
VSDAEKSSRGPFETAPAASDSGALHRYPPSSAEPSAQSAPQNRGDAEDAGRRKLIRFRLGLGAAVSLLVAITVGSVSWATYLNTRAAIVTQTNDRVDGLLRELGERVESHLLRAVPAVELSRMLVRDSLVRSDLDSLARQFTLVLRNNPSFSWMSYSDEAGNFTGAYRTPEGELHVSQSTIGHGRSELREHAVSESGKWTPSLHQSNYGYDPRIDQFYSAAKNAGARVWIGPYVFFDEGVPGITCASPYFSPENQLRGVFTVDFNLNVLSRFVAALPFGEHGRVFILTSDGTLIAHPTLRLVQVTGQGSQGKLVTIANAEDPLLQPWFAAWQKTTARSGENSGAQFSFEFRQQRYMAGYRKIEIDRGLSWILGAVAPESDFLGVLTKNRRAAFLIMIGALGFGVLVTLALARRIAAPLASLASEMEEVGDFQLSARPRMPTIFREVAWIDRSLVKMKGGLRSFAYYVPKDLVRAVLASGQEARLEGRTRQLTVYFSDIAGFTSLAETMSPDQLVMNMSRYLDEMTRIIARCGGTVDKFIGDAIMAFWGAPLPDADHSARACEAAVRCQQRLAELRASAETPWLANLHARIGIASGDVLVGNVGTPERFNYTVMGDTVNLASRLESLNKLYGTSILVSEATYLAAETRVVGRPVDIVQVKGKHGGLRVYELLCLASDDNPRANELAAIFENALAAYLARDFRGALERLENVRKIDAGDRPAEVLRQRCQRYIASPPPENWNGVYVATEK